MKFNDKLANLINYEAGKPIELVVREYGIDSKDVIKLASNENPFGTSPRVQKALCEIANKAHLYPDDSYYELKDALAAKFGVGARNIIIGAGSDQILEFCLHAKANDNSAVLMAGITFAMYEIYAKQVGAKVIKTASQQHDLSEFKAIYEEHKDQISVIFLCLPNNPLGECLDAKDVYEFIAGVGENTLVVIDAAYNEFAKFKDAKKAIDPAFVVENFTNAIFTATFSKAYGLGGMRVGYGIAREEIISELGKLRAPFNITTLSLRAAIEALKDEEFVKMGIESNFAQMARYEDFAREHKLSFIPSYTNFINIEFGEKNASDIAQTLLKKGIILRDMKSYGMNAIRITIGTASQNDRLFEELDKILK